MQNHAMCMFSCFKQSETMWAWHVYMVQNLHFQTICELACMLKSRNNLLKVGCKWTLNLYNRRIVENKLFEIWGFLVVN